MSYVLKRISEPSSWAGLSAIAAGLQQIAANPAQWCVGVGVVAGGIAAFFVPEKAS